MELSVPGRKTIVLAAQAALATAVVAAGVHLSRQTAGAVPSELELGMLKLAAAAAIGYLVSSTQKHAASERTSNASMEHAQVLLCVAGALIVMLIGDSMARAVGILGGAAIVRFRTPVDDPKEAAVLFLMLGLGMASGMGHFAIAGFGALFLSGILIIFGGTKANKLRSLTLQVVSAGAEAPAGAVESVLRRRAAFFEPREISRGDKQVMRYQVSIDPALPLGELSRELLDAPGAEIQSVSFDTPKKERYL
jgi:uncharacterized protein GlcG (DUF336 family)